MEASLPQDDTFGVDQLTAEASGVDSHNGDCHTVR
jgi:hypothetical protein